MGGAAIQWLRDGINLIQNAAQSEALATSVPDNGGVYFVPALTGMGAPYWDQYARGAMLGLTRGTTPAHITRATLEGIAFQVYDILKAMEHDTKRTSPEMRVDGGAVANNFSRSRISGRISHRILARHGRITPTMEYRSGIYPH